MASLSDDLFIFLGVFLICIIVIVIVLQNVRPNAIVVLTPKEGSLSTPTNIGSMAQIRSLFFTPASSTFTTYMYCNALDKTPKLNNMEPTILFQFGNAIQFILNPAGASTQSTTQLVIKTQGPTVQTETVDIPYFPTQKWVYIGLVREGRRFTVYYDGVAVSSHRTQYFPVISSTQLIIGDPKISGQFKHPNLVATALNSSDLNKYRNLSADTRDKPYSLQSRSSMFWFIPSIGCPDGIFCFSTNGPPTSNPLVSWKSNYA